MNKLLIPSILTAIVLVAGMFAVMPIEKASTVHTTIIAAIKSTGGAGSTLSVPFDVPAGAAALTIPVLKGQTGLTYKVNAQVAIYENTGVGTVTVQGSVVPTAIVAATTAGATGVFSSTGAFVTIAAAEGVSILVTAPVAGAASGIAGTVTLQVTQ